MIAINKRHQSMVNRAVKWIEKYNKANEQRDIAIENAILCLKRQMEIETEKMVADLRQM